jgi:hypothetical protein
MIYAPDGRCLKKINLNESEDVLALGIRTARWSPSSQFLALGSYDNKVCYCFYWFSFIRFDLSYIILLFLYLHFDP